MLREMGTFRGIISWKAVSCLDKFEQDAQLFVFSMIASSLNSFYRSNQNKTAKVLHRYAMTEFLPHGIHLKHIFE